MRATNSNRTQAPPPQQASQRSRMVIYPTLHPQYSHPNRLHFSLRSTFPSPLSLLLFCVRASEYSVPFSWCSLSSPWWPADSRLSSLVSWRATSSGPSSGVLFMVLSYLPWRKAPQLSMICFLSSSPLNPQVSPCHFIFHCKPVPEQCLAQNGCSLNSLHDWVNRQELPDLTPLTAPVTQGPLEA